MPQSRNTQGNTLYKRIETEIGNYRSKSVELSEGVHFSQHRIIKRIYKFKNRDLSGSKLNEDLSYNYYYDIILPRANSETKNIRFDTKHILVFSRNPIKDFAAAFVSNAVLKDWMAENGEGMKLKSAVEEYTANGNIGFKRVSGGYELVDPLNTYITNQLAETVDDTAILERHVMTASQLKAMSAWDQAVVDTVIANLSNKSFKATENTTSISSTTKRYEIFEYSGEVSEAEYNQITGMSGGDSNKYFLAKVVIAGLRDNGTGTKHILFVERIDSKLSDYYIYAHRGKYEGRFWRVGMYELLFDHQIRANEIGNQLARGLDWASKVVFRSSSARIMQNIRADIDNGDVIISDDLAQVDTRMSGLDQLIADWNRLMEDADRLSNSFEIVRGETMPSGTPFRLGALMDRNAGMMFVLLRQKITLPYKRVFREWILPKLVKELSGEDIFTLVGEIEILEQLREIMVDQWYMNNLVKIGPHTQEVADAIKAVKIDELSEIDPIIENSKEIWKGVLPRLYVTITGENSDIADQVTDLITLVGLEEDPMRRAWLLDQIYRVRNIPIPPKIEQPTPVVSEAGKPAASSASPVRTGQQPPIE